MFEQQADRGAEVFSGLTHEGRNALQQIQAGLRLLRLVVDTDQREASEILDTLAESIQRLDRLFADIDDYSAPVEVNLATCDAGAAWRTACARLGGTGRETQLEPCPVRGDPLLLEEAFCRIAECLLGRPPDPARIDVRSEDVARDEPTVRIILRAERAPEQPSSRGRDSVSFVIAERLIEAQGGELQRDGAGNAREISLLLRRVDTGD